MSTPISAPSYKPSIALAGIGSAVLATGIALHILQMGAATALLASGSTALGLDAFFTALLARHKKHLKNTTPQPSLSNQLLADRIDALARSLNTQMAGLNSGIDSLTELVENLPTAEVPSADILRRLTDLSAAVGGVRDSMADLPHAEIMEKLDLLSGAVEDLKGLNADKEPNTAVLDQLATLVEAVKELGTAVAVAQAAQKPSRALLDRLDGLGEEVRNLGSRLEAPPPLPPAPSSPAPHTTVTMALDALRASVETLETRVGTLKEFVERAPTDDAQNVDLDALATSLRELPADVALAVANGEAHALLVARLTEVQTMVAALRKEHPAGDHLAESGDSVEEAASAMMERLGGIEETLAALTASVKALRGADGAQVEELAARLDEMAVDLEASSSAEQDRAVREFTTRRKRALKARSFKVWRAAAQEGQAQRSQAEAHYDSKALRRCFATWREATKTGQEAREVTASQERGLKARSFKMLRAAAQEGKAQAHYNSKVLGRSFTTWRSLEKESRDTRAGQVVEGSESGGASSDGPADIYRPSDIAGGSASMAPTSFVPTVSEGAFISARKTTDHDFGLLDDALLLAVFSFLNHDDLATVCAVNRRWARVAQDEVFVGRQSEGLALSRMRRHVTVCDVADWGGVHGLNFDPLPDYSELDRLDDFVEAAPWFDDDWLMQIAFPEGLTYDVIEAQALEAGLTIQWGFERTYPQAIPNLKAVTTEPRRCFFSLTRLGSIATGLPNADKLRAFDESDLEPLNLLEALTVCVMYWKQTGRRAFPQSTLLTPTAVFTRGGEVHTALKMKGAVIEINPVMQASFAAHGVAAAYSIDSEF